ncbi:MAG: MBL fold metallo-hydrolase, partial [Gammaproteobacteria bacterium]|nr:MBL fold metallo-hydrolase [Gammaproteobacteria bacterium]
MKISFHGAAQGVTGSCHLLECAGKRILIDCGFYQGSRELEEDNADEFGFDAASIDYLLLTHAHLDHCGRIPLLVNRGFKGEIITTSASRELARLIMLDAAGLQEEEARYLNRRARRRGQSSDVIVPLYTTLDALNALEYLGRTARYKQVLQLSPDIQATFIDAGHILGSASILLELTEGSEQRRILFSGDLGLAGRPILRDPDVPPQADIVVMETTYGDRQHKQLEPSVDELYQVINETVERGGNVIIPTFALERAQELLYYLHAGKEQKILSGFLQVFLDSPMAISATKIFGRHPECYDEQTAKLFSTGRDPFQFPGLHFVRETADSMAINQISGAVIMAGSGMCTGGRVRHHLKHHLGRDRSSIIFVGYAARGTLARSIVDGAKTVKIFG